MAELLINLEPQDIIAFLSLIFGFGGGYITASVNIHEHKQTQVVGSGNAFQAGGNMNINTGENNEKSCPHCNH